MNGNQKNPLVLLIFGGAMSGAMYKIGIGDPIYFVFFLIGILIFSVGLIGLISTIRG